MFIFFPPVGGVLQSLQHHPRENQYRFEHAYCALDWVGRVAKVQSHLAQQDMKPVMMIATERACEPCDEMAPAHMVGFDSASAAADYTSADFLLWPGHDRLTIVR
jgi:hypothetical protein